MVAGEKVVTLMVAEIPNTHYSRGRMFIMQVEVQGTLKPRFRLYVDIR